MDNATRRKSFFEFDSGVDAFIQSFTTAVALYTKRFRANFVPPENELRFFHGGGWQRPAGEENMSGDMKMLSTVLQTRLDDIIANDLGLLQRSFSQVGDSMMQQFADLMYGTLSQACDITGNVVNAQQQGSLSDGVLAALEKVEFGVDKDGNVHMPQIHAPPGIAERMIAELEGRPAEFKEKIERLKQQKTQEAIERESVRKAKFVRYGG